MRIWINGRRGSTLESQDRGLQYGDGLFETMRVRGRRIRFLDFHLERLYGGCRSLNIAAPDRALLQAELEHIAVLRPHGILKLIITRGAGQRGYRPSGAERCNRIATLQPLPAEPGSGSVRVRLCATPLSVNPRLAGLKTLNRLDSVLARAEWRDVRIWEGLMHDSDGTWVCGTMSNMFLVHGRVLTTPLLDRCGVAGVMRRWVQLSARAMGLRVAEKRVRLRELASADEVFLSNAMGIRSVRSIESRHATALRYAQRACADHLRSLLEQQ